MTSYSQIISFLITYISTDFSIETLILRVLSDFLQAADEGDIAILALMDLSAAFGKVYHSILQRLLQIIFDCDGTTLQ